MPHSLARKGQALFKNVGTRRLKKVLTSCCFGVLACGPLIHILWEQPLFCALADFCPVQFVPRVYEYYKLSCLRFPSLDYANPHVPSVPLLNHSAKEQPMENDCPHDCHMHPIASNMTNLPVVHGLQCLSPIEKLC